jgi:hypothetical protein
MKAQGGELHQKLDNMILEQAARPSKFGRKIKQSKTMDHISQAAIRNTLESPKGLSSCLGFSLCDFCMISISLHCFATLKHKSHKDGGKKSACF